MNKWLILSALFLGACSGSNSRSGSKSPQVPDEPQKSTVLAERLLKMNSRDLVLDVMWTLVKAAEDAEGSAHFQNQLRKLDSELALNCQETCRIWAKGYVVDRRNQIKSKENGESKNEK